MSGQRGVQADPTTGSRNLSVLGFIGVVIVYLAVLQGVGLLATSGLDGSEYLQFRTKEEVALGLLLPVGASLLFAFGVVAWLGWWRPVLHDHVPVQRWVRIVPIIIFLSIAVAINYSGLLDTSAGFVLLLLAGCLCVGFAEETMFRGIGVTTFRVNGFTEGKVALWSSVIFGLVHITNIFSEGGGAIAQAVIVMFAGYFFYLTRRASGGLLLPAIAHGLFDFSLISGSVIDDDVYAGSAAIYLAYIALAIILLVRRHRIEPEGAAGAPQPA